MSRGQGIMHKYYLIKEQKINFASQYGKMDLDEVVDCNYKQAISVRYG